VSAKAFESVIAEKSSLESTIFERFSGFRENMKRECTNSKKSSTQAVSFKHCEPALISTKLGLNRTML
jgi:hypothetical protein